MVPSSADIAFQNRWISQSETSTINIGWRCKYNLAYSMRGLAEIETSLRQYFRFLLDYRDIRIYPNEWTMACALMQTNYFVVVVLPSRQIKRVVRLTACNYVYLWRYFPDEKYGYVDYKRYHLIKWIKKERLNRLHPFNRLNMSWKLIYTLYVNQAEGVLSV